MNYTSYDGRRSQDYFNPRTHYDVMVLGRDDDGERNPHPYWYARIIKILSVTFRYIDSAGDSWNTEPQTMHVLWVRWFGRDTQSPAGWEKLRLHTVGFVHEDDDAAFGFLDPDQIVRGAHLLPAFDYHRTTELLQPSIARRPEEKDEDWKYFDVNWCIFLAFSCEYMHC